jgi:hypothetical protein
MYHYTSHKHEQDKFVGRLELVNRVDIQLTLRQGIILMHMETNGFPIQDGSSDELDELNEHVHDPGDPDGVIAAEQHEQWQQSNPMPAQAAPQTAYRPKKLWPKIVITVLILLGAAYGSYWFGNHEATNKQKKPTTSQQQATQATAPTTKHYDSTNYALGFNYPSNWVVNDSTTKLTVTSPAMQLTTATGAKTSAHVVITIQNQQTAIPNFPSGGATATLASDHLSYTQPSSVQRAQTYLSYLSYTTLSGLDAMYITGDSGYQQGQTVPMGDIVKGNPLISVNFESCTDDNCVNGKPITLSANSWQSSATNKSVISTIESIVLVS